MNIDRLLRRRIGINSSNESRCRARRSVVSRSTSGTADQQRSSRTINSRLSTQRSSTKHFLHSIDRSFRIQLDSSSALRSAHSARSSSRSQTFTEREHRLDTSVDLRDGRRRSARQFLRSDDHFSQSKVERKRFFPPMDFLVAHRMVFPRTKILTFSTATSSIEEVKASRFYF